MGTTAWIYEAMTKRLLALMESGTIPWRRTWRQLASPRNIRSDKPYRGTNCFWLAVIASTEGYSTPYWMTYKQAIDLGGHVRKGEKATPVIFWKPATYKSLVGEDGDGGEIEVKKSYLVVRLYYVFNLDQCDGIAAPAGQPQSLRPLVTSSQDACEDASRIFTEYCDHERITVRNGGDQPSYIPSTDTIQVPKMEMFNVVEDYHATRFHEAVHSTGADGRCSRSGVKDFDSFGSHQYAEEELIAEFGSTFLCSIAGVERTETVENAAAYLQHWAAALRANPSMVVMAAQRAQKACDYILNQTSENGLTP